MDILAAFLVIGLLLSGMKALFRHLHENVRWFNSSEIVVLNADADTINLLTVASNETNRRDTNFIRITSTRKSNDRMKRLAFPGKEKATLPDYGISSLGTTA
jgi:hypothetical protein